MAAIAGTQNVVGIPALLPVYSDFDENVRRHTPQRTYKMRIFPYVIIHWIRTRVVDE